MKGEDYKRAFGSAPDTLKDSIARTLETVQEEKPMKKTSIRTVLIVALVLVILMGVAYAAMSQLGLKDYFAQWEQLEFTEEAQELLAFDKPLASVTIDGVRADVTGAVADGRSFYVSVLFTPEDDNVLLVGPTDYPINLPEDEVPGRRLVTAGVNTEGENIQGQMGDHLMQPDGTMMLVEVGTLETDTGEVTLSSTFKTVDTEPGGYPQYETEKSETVTFTIPVGKTIEQRHADVEIPLADGALTLTSITLDRTVLTTYYTFVYTAEEGSDDPMTRVDLMLCDADGKPLPSGALAYGIVDSPDDIHYTSTGSLTFQSLPDTIHVLPHDLWQYYDVVEVPLADGPQP